MINFIQNIINEDIRQNKNQGKVHTRFPPEPNGYLHIGHAKSICLNFGIAEANKGLCNLRFDDTNPSKEDTEYVEAIRDDVRWLGFSWGDRMFYASDYFEKMYEYAVQLVKLGKAYVCDLSSSEIRDYRGTLTGPGKESPYRKRSVEENLELFEKMKNGEFADGACVLRAKIDMASSNINMRDPVLYRILHAEHHRTGNRWCIYPMYDYAHPISDSLEGITHSICTLEFEDHRPLYDWLLETLGIHHPQQIEFARLNLKNTVMSKRILRRLVEEKFVEGWDDPRMPTISGLRRRGYTPEAIRDFCERIGVAKSNSTVDISLLEHCIREDLNGKAPRVMAVLEPIRVIVENYPQDKVEWLEAENNPQAPEMGSRKIPFSRELYIEREDFMEIPPKKYNRLTPSQEVRLKHAYIIKCERIVKNEHTGEVKEIYCTYDPKSKSGEDQSGKKVKGTIHWLSAAHALAAEIRLFDYLMLDEDSALENEESAEPNDFTARYNHDSVVCLKGAFVEPGLAGAKPGLSYQFLRQGYFCPDNLLSKKEKLVFNRVVALRDTWSKIEARSSL